MINEIDEILKSMKSIGLMAMQQKEKLLRSSMEWSHSELRCQEISRDILLLLDNPGNGDIVIELGKKYLGLKPI